MKFMGTAMAGIGSSRSFVISVSLLITATLCFCASLFMLLKDASQDSKYLQMAGDLRVFAHQVSTSSREATSGDASAFAELNKSTERFDSTLAILRSGNQTLSGVESEMSQEISGLSSVWKKVSDDAKTIVNNRERILFLHDVARTLDESIPELQREYENIVEILLERGAKADQVILAQKQTLLAERIARNVDKMIEGSTTAQQAADQFNLDASIFGGVLNGMLKGDRALGISKVNSSKAVKSLERVEKLFRFVSSSVDDIFSASPDLLSARSAAESIVVNSPKVLEQTALVAEGVRNLSDKRWFGADSAIAFGGLILLMLAIIGYQLYRQTVSRLAEQREANERNQSAIQRLLAEISDLADGDLTAEATVSEDFTGAIADSINFTVEQLREIVSSINDTTVQVNSAARETQNKAMALAEASSEQSNEISSASRAIQEMSQTMVDMSEEASKSATVAKSSVEIAKSGAGVVQNTIRGMDTIREQIQDTSKRIKRLGESSQEIGDIVSLITDIADQTNILALNASIQASMAGEAGRGFAVVADEVQRLAERSSGATKQIEALVRTIQSDTNEAVISMEQTTSQVVTGAGLAHDAGVALEEIERVSANLSELIETISGAAKSQADMASNVTVAMDGVQKTTTQTAAGTTDAASKMGTLSDMTNKLRDSVAGFKLPGSQSAQDFEVSDKNVA